MTVRVLLFARYQEMAGSPSIEVEVRPGATLAEVWETVRQRVSGLGDGGPPLMALDRDYATPDRVVETGREVAFFPPVSGG